MEQVTEPLWASDSSSIKWGDHTCLKWVVSRDNWNDGVSKALLYLHKNMLGKRQSLTSAASFLPFAFPSFASRPISPLSSLLHTKQNRSRLGTTHAGHSLFACRSAAHISWAAPDSLHLTCLSGYGLLESSGHFCDPMSVSIIVASSSGPSSCRSHEVGTGLQNCLHCSHHTGVQIRPRGTHRGFLSPHCFQI